MPATVLGGRYRLDERLAATAVAELWRGHDDVLGRTVAVKVLPAHLRRDAAMAAQFVAAARVVAALKHACVVDVYDIGPGYLVMEYVDGGNLADALHRFGRLTANRTMTIVALAADAVHAAHLRGIVHRDIRPENVLMRRTGVPVLAGFDIALTAANAGPSALLAGALLSPEQAAGRLATPLSDVYALGVVAFQCLAGAPPFRGANPLEVAMNHVRQPAPPLPADVPGPVRQVVARAMAKDPAQRWPTAATLAVAARAVTAGANV